MATPEAGIPVVATRRAAGFVDLDRAGREVPPGDAEALRRAVREILAGPRPSTPQPPAPGWSAVAARLRSLLTPDAPGARPSAPAPPLTADGPT